MTTRFKKTGKDDSNVNAMSMMRKCVFVNGLLLILGCASGNSNAVGGIVFYDSMWPYMKMLSEPEAAELESIIAGGDVEVRGEVSNKVGNLDSQPCALLYSCDIQFAL